MNRTKLWINDQWIEAARTIPLNNPHTGEILAEIGYASPAQAELAIVTAAQAFESLCEQTSYERAEILYRVVKILERRFEEAAHLIVVEAAKPIQLARKEIERTIQTYL
ncbi:MAG: safD, partial [Bacilli bacterium]|nr:safD [Bacilli bacterium]